MPFNLKSIICVTTFTCLISACGGGSSSKEAPPTTSTPVTPNISIADVAVTEGNEGTTEAVFTVTLSQATTNTVTVDYATSDETASAGEDYIAASSTLTFNANSTSQQITVIVNNDVKFEEDESFTVSLSNPSNSNISTSSATGSIMNDDISKLAALKKLKADVMNYIESLPKRGFGYDEYLDGAYEIDLEADGDLDLVLMISKDAQSVNEEMIIFYNNEGAGFEMVQSGINAWAGDVTVADFNGDGLDDMYLGAGGLDLVPFPGARDQLLIQQQDGTLVDMTEGNLPNDTFFTHSVCSGDIDSDGDIDVYVGNMVDEDYDLPLFYMNDGTGKFTANKDAIPFDEFNQYALRTWCEMADFDGNGTVDLAIGVANNKNPGNEKQKHHVVLFNDSNGNFEYNTESSFLDSFLETESAPGGSNDTAIDMQFIDINKDGCGELTVMVTDYNDRTHLNIYENNCTQEFTLINRIDVSGNKDGWQPYAIGTFEKDGITHFNLHMRHFYQRRLGDANNNRVLENTSFNAYQIRLIKEEEFELLTPFQFVGTYFEEN